MKWAPTVWAAFGTPKMEPDTTAESLAAATYDAKVNINVLVNHVAMWLGVRQYGSTTAIHQVFLS